MGSQTIGTHTAGSAWITYTTTTDPVTAIWTLGAGHCTLHSTPGDEAKTSPFPQRYCISELGLMHLERSHHSGENEGTEGLV